MKNLFKNINKIKLSLIKNLIDFIIIILIKLSNSCFGFGKLCFEIMFRAIKCGFTSTKQSRACMAISILNQFLNLIRVFI